MNSRLPTISNFAVLDTYIKIQSVIYRYNQDEIIKLA